jgi:hypothetical protein
MKPPSYRTGGPLARLAPRARLRRRIGALLRLVPLRLWWRSRTAWVDEIVIDYLVHTVRRRRWIGRRGCPGCVAQMGPHDPRRLPDQLVRLEIAIRRLEAHVLPPEPFAAPGRPWHTVVLAAVLFGLLAAGVVAALATAPAAPSPWRPGIEGIDP